MIDLGLSPTDRALYEAALLESHQIRVTINVRDHNETTVLSDLTSHSVLLSGSVNVDTTATVTRGLQLVVLDPDHHLLFDAFSPADGSVFADRFLEVLYGVWVEALSDWVDVPVFWGPVTHFERKGAEVTIEGQGKESLAVKPVQAWDPQTIPRGTQTITAIHRLMDPLGEARYDMPTFSHRLPRPLSVPAAAEPWVLVKRLAAGASGRQAYYDGRGKLRLRTLPGSPVYTFTDQGSLERPQVTYDVTTNFRNVVVAIGQPPRGSKKTIRWVATPPTADPFSPISMGRNGKPRRFVATIHVPTARTIAQAKTAAEAELGRRIRQSVAVTLAYLPVPHLEERDLVRLENDQYSIAFEMNQFSIPLTSDTPMGVGTTFLTRVKQP